MIEFFGDENTSERILKILDIYDSRNSIIWMPNYLKENGFRNDGRGIPDVEWLEFMGKNKPEGVILGNDNRIPENPAECRVLKESNLMFVALSKQWGNYDLENQIIKIIGAWNEIVKQVKKAHDPITFFVKFKKGKNRPEIEIRGNTKDLK